MLLLLPEEEVVAGLGRGVRVGDWGKGVGFVNIRWLCVGRV